MLRFIIASALFVSLLSGGSFTLASDTLKGELSKREEYRGFGCNGENRSPELHWSDAPRGTKSFALTLFDPDAPTGNGWWHWIVVNIPSNVTELPEDASAKHLLPKGAIETVTNFGKPGFGGPCPPRGDKAHAYVFTLYALDTEKLDVNEKTDSAHVESLIRRHMLEKATLVSHYQRK